MGRVNFRSPTPNLNFVFTAKAPGLGKHTRSTVIEPTMGRPTQCTSITLLVVVTHTHVHRKFFQLGPSRTRTNAWRESRAAGKRALSLTGPPTMGEKIKRPVLSKHPSSKKKNNKKKKTTSTQILPPSRLGKQWPESKSLSSQISKNVSYLFIWLINILI